MWPTNEVDARSVDAALKGRRSKDGFTRAWRSRGQRLGGAVLIVAVVAPFAGARPVGSEVFDWAWAAGLAAAAAALGSTSKRGPLLIAAVVAVASARSGLALSFSGLAVGFAVLSTRHLRRRAVFARALSGGAAAIAMLATARHLGTVEVLIAVSLVGACIVVSGYRHATATGRRWFAVGVVGVLGASFAATAAAGVGVLENARGLDRGTQELQLGLAAARLGDTKASQEHLEGARLLLSQARVGMSRWGTAARVVPLAAQHVSAVTSVLADVEAASTQAGEVAGIAVQSHPVISGGQVDLQALRDLRAPLKRLALKLGKVVSDADRDASEPLVAPLKDRLSRLRVTAARAARDAATGADAARLMPAILGGSGPRRYLVLFTSPSEARGRFGFPGSFALVTFDGGAMHLGEHGSTTAAFLQPVADQSRFDLGDPLLRPYVPFAATEVLYGTTTPPDFPTVARAAAAVWAQSGRAPVDGVIRLDPASLAALLAFTGPVDVPGLAQPLSSQNVEQFLDVGQYVQFPTLLSPRRELLVDVADETFRRLQTVDLPAPRALFAAFGPLAREGHLQMSTFFPAEATLLEQVGVAGSFPAPPSDGLFVTNVNAIGNKIDSLLSKSVSYAGTVQSGRLDATLKVSLHNAAPSSGLPFYVIGQSVQPAPPLGTNRTVLLVYASAPAAAVTVDGRPTEVAPVLTGGRWLHEIVVTLAPGATSSVELRLAGTLPSGPYRLDLEPGGGTTPDRYLVDIAVGGRRLHLEDALVSPSVLR